MGCLDTVENVVATGWVFDPSRPDLRLKVELRIDGEFFGEFHANQFRRDLPGAGVGDGSHAFRIPLPAHLLDGKRHRFEVNVSGSKIALKNSPMEKTWGEPRDASVTQKDVAGAVAIQERRGTFDRYVGRLSRKDSAKPPASGDTLSESLLSGISVVIPTYNRGALMEETLRACLDATTDIDVEFILIDDGSSDDTPQRLERLAGEFPGLKWKSVPNGGPGQARNVGVEMASHELVLFQGDDIRPASEHFYWHHVNAHRMLPARNVAVLGKITWPNSQEERINYVMSHVQGAGEQQFAYYRLMPYSWLDWRFFYTSNVSFKKSFVGSWKENGFDKSFRVAAWEDAEFAYRLHKSNGAGFKILYCPAPVATHHHAYAVKEFIERQISTGLMAKTMVEAHPEVAKQVGVQKLRQLLASPSRGKAEPVEDFLSMIEGIKAWPSVIEQRYNLGSQNWHADLLSAVFELCYLQGFVMAHEDPGANYGAAYAYILERFQEKMSASASFETFGRFPSFTLT